MDKQRITVTLHLHRARREMDLDLPLEITVNELIQALRQGLGVRAGADEMSGAYLKAENPTALLRGDKTLEECGLRDGSSIHITE